MNDARNLLNAYLSQWGLDERALMKQFKAGSSNVLLAALKDLLVAMHPSS